MEIWAHRGARTEAPENTTLAFARAIECGADGVELDVQCTRDGHLVVIHDEQVDRTTDGSGWVKDYSLADLRQLDASAGMRGFPEAKIPTLAEVLDLLRPADIRANIELKNSKVDYPGLEDMVWGEVNAAGMNDRVVLSSFNAESVAKLVQVTTAEVAMLFEANELLCAPWRRAEQLRVAAIHVPRLRAYPGLVRRCRGAGLRVRVWTVNQTQARDRMSRWGVAGVFTDIVRVMKTDR